MTLNAVIALILRFFSRNSTDFQTNYITVVEDTPIMSVKYCLPVPVFYFWRKLSRTLQRGLSAIAEHLVYSCHVFFQFFNVFNILYLNFSHVWCVWCVEMRRSCARDHVVLVRRRASLETSRTFNRTLRTVPTTHTQQGPTSALIVSQVQARMYKRNLRTILRPKIFGK